MVLKFIEKLFPKESPMKLMKKHASIALESVSYLENAFQLYFEGKNISQISEKVDKLEQDADDLKVEIRKSYSTLKFVYFDKVDTLFVLHEQDNIIDAVDDVLKMLMMNDVKDLDKSVIENFISLIRIVNESVKIMVKTVDNLLKIAESSFSEIEISKELKEIFEVEKEESKSDMMNVALGKKLYSLKYDMNAVDLFFLQKIALKLGKIADKAERIVEKVRLIIKA